MNSKQIILQITKDLKVHRDLEYKKGSIRYFKEPIDPIGVRAKDTRAIAANYYREVKDLSQKQLFSLCEQLLKTGKTELGTIAFDWAKRKSKEYKPQDFAVFEGWLKKYVKNWAHCDDFCNHAFGSLLFQYPNKLIRVKKWTSSRNRWMKRASAIIMIYPLRKGNEKWLKECFTIADKLLIDGDDLVQKGYGWMLKVAAERWEKEVFDYVMINKNKMPRTALRYAIEKMPKDMKKKAMER